jgi:hypothetical protein
VSNQAGKKDSGRFVLWGQNAKPNADDTLRSNDAGYCENCTEKDVSGDCVKTQSRRKEDLEEFESLRRDRVPLMLNPFADMTDYR